MVTALLALVALAPAPSVQTVEVFPTDDIWIYPHASDPQKDPFLRVWGVGGEAVAANADDAADFSYAFLKFDLSKIPAGKISSVKFVVTHIADPGWTDAQVKDAPLEVRSVSANFAEKGWNYEMARALQPKAGKKEFFGFASAKIAPGKTIPFEFDLWKADEFRKAFESGRKDGAFAVALTSTIDPAVVGRGGIYKLYSKDDEKVERRPKLVVEVAP